MIEFRNVSKKYDTGTEAVHNANFKIDKGEFAFLVGSSGSGKSTVLRCINQLEKIDAGNIKICGDSMIKEIKTENKLPKKYDSKNKKVVYYIINK